jgi:hypothetical protein
MIKRALLISVIVGSALTFINMSDVLVSSAIALPQGIRLLLNFAVPFTVSLVSSYLALRRK